jgi:hypothetical protein
MFEWEIFFLCGKKIEVCSFFFARKIITLNNHINSQLNNTLELFQMWQRKLFFQFFCRLLFSLSHFPCHCHSVTKMLQFFSHLAHQSKKKKKKLKKNVRIRVLFWQECAIHWMQCGGKRKLEFKLNK